MQKGKCKFYREGQIASCKNGEKCPYLHQHNTKPQLRRPISEENGNSNTQKRREPEIDDPEAREKRKYVLFMKDLLKQECKICKERTFLVITDCGCQSQCEVCAKSREKCPCCKNNYNNRILIKSSD